jgi:phosphoserine aminotransferase
MPNQLFFTPGPSQLYHTVPQHLKNAIKENIGSISHRDKTFQLLFQEMKERLKDVLKIPTDYEIFITSSATEVWERIVQNLITECSHHFVNGSFSQRFFEFTQDYQLKSSFTNAGFGNEFSHFDVPYHAELIAVTQNETSIGYTFDPRQLETLRSSYPEKLIAIDLVSAVPGIQVDLTQVDTAYFSVQKCFGLPAGMGIWIVNSKCIETSKLKASHGHIIGSYHALSVLKSHGDKNQTPETPNILSLYLLTKVLKDMQLKGISNIQNETKYKAAVLYQTFEKIAQLNPFVETAINRSKTVCVAEVLDGNNGLIEYLGSKNFIIGTGYGAYRNNHIRIANFPTHSKEEIEQLVDYIEHYYK